MFAIILANIARYRSLTFRIKCDNVTKSNLKCPSLFLKRAIVHFVGNYAPGKHTDDIRLIGIYCAASPV